MDGTGSIDGIGAGSSSFVSAGLSQAGDLRQTREILSRAALKVNHAGYAGAGREVTFSIDTVTRRPVIKVLETESKEVVAQWPSEYLLRLAEEFDRSKGIQDESH